jgi:hypothetical protein
MTKTDGFESRGTAPPIDKTADRITLDLSCVSSLRGCSDPADLFQSPDTSAPDLRLHSARPKCSSAALAWSSIWSAGNYPNQTRIAAETWPLRSPTGQDEWKWQASFPALSLARYCM